MLERIDDAVSAQVGEVKMILAGRGGGDKTDTAVVQERPVHQGDAPDEEGLGVAQEFRRDAVRRDRHEVAERPEGVLKK